MLRNTSWLVLVLILILPGCTAPAAIDSAEAENEMDIPERLNLIADTANREIDRVETMDVLLDANGKNTMILWVSTGCSGCHDWTEMIADGMRNGNISNDTRIITVHRYPSFESREEVIEVYASSNSSTESLWPVLIPNEGQPAIDVDKNQETEYDYSKAFETPATPSLTILDGEGNTIWKNKTYWYNSSVLSEALEILD
tara:strand:+ start:564 stop:1163 length:600 start_codon:yes stop_codon:yes gene_type:complete